MKCRIFLGQGPTPGRVCGLRMYSTVVCMQGRRGLFHSWVLFYCFQSVGGTVEWELWDREEVVVGGEVVVFRSVDILFLCVRGYEAVWWS